MPLLIRRPHVHPLETLDPRSIGLTLSISGFALTAVLWAARRDGDTMAGINAWVLSAASLASGIGLNSLQDVLPDLLTRAVGNTLMITAVMLAWHGARAFRGVTTGTTTLLVTMFVALMWNLAVVYLWPIPRWRVFGFSLLMAFACLLAGTEFLRQQQPHLRAAARFGAVPLLFFALLMLARGIDALRRTEIATALTPTPVNVATYLLGSVVLLASVAAMVMSVNAMRAAQVRELVYRDALTGALSRRGLYAALPRWMQEHQPGATIAVLDANGFKRINDSLGHEVGDRVLQALVECCRQRLPASALVARFGGDEFVLLLPPAIQVDNVLSDVASTFVQTSQALLSANDEYLAPSVAVGHAPIPAPDLNAFKQALRDADAVMYENKQQQR